MANLYYYLDMRAPRKDGSGSLKLALSHLRKTAYEGMDVYLRPDEWNDEIKQVVKRDDRKFLNVLLKKRMAECTLVLQRILLRNDVSEFDCKQILSMCLRGSDTADEPNNADYVIPVYNEYITLARKPATANTYRASLNNLLEYDPNIDTLRFKDINVAWLRRYQRWLEDERGMSVNGANVYLRNLRTIFNFALKEQYTFARYPFKDIDMSTTEPDKRSIAWDKFLEWVSWPLDYGREFYRDLFMLSYYLCGIRPVDLLYAKKCQVEDGRLVYYPEKLNGRTKLSIKIEPEAWEIINKFPGKGEYLLNVMERREDYKAFMHHWNAAIKAVGPDIPYTKKVSRNREYLCVRHTGIVPFITVYYSRTFWSSFCYNVLDAPMDVISQGLGHKSGLKVTNFYVKRDTSRVDALNRQMIDRLKEDVAAYKAAHAIA